MVDGKFPKMAFFLVSVMRRSCFWHVIFSCYNVFLIGCSLKIVLLEMKDSCLQSQKWFVWL